MFFFLNLSIKLAKNNLQHWLTVYSKCHKICTFESHVTRNDVILMSLPKTMENNGKMRTSAEPNKIYIVQKVLMRAIQKLGLITCNLNQCRALNRFWNKNYDKNKTNLGENRSYQLRTLLISVLFFRFFSAFPVKFLVGLTLLIKVLRCYHRCKFPVPFLVQD